VRRAVYDRDGEQSTFVDDEGRRSPSRAFLELDHTVSQGVGGSDELRSLRVGCQAHNKLHKENVFGRDHVERQIRLRRQKCGAADASAFETAARGLRNFGFRESEVRRALAAVRAKLDPATTSTEAVLREALAVAT
jgi:RuvA, C-terminal domain